MGSEDSVTAFDFVGSIKPWGRLVYDQIIIVSIVSLLGVLFAFPVFTIGPVCLAAIATVSHSVHQRSEIDSVTDSQLTRRFLGSIREQFRRGLLFSVLIVGSLLVTVVYLSLAFESGSALFWIGSAFGLYTLLAVVLLTFRTGYVLARTDDELGAVDAAVAGIDVAKRAPGYSALQYLFGGLLVVVLTALPIFGMVLLIGVLAVLEIVAYETIENDGPSAFFDESGDDPDLQHN